jgi:trk system potassium uptake protein TrkA
MRIVIVGGGEVGYGLSQALAARHEVVVIDRAQEAADRFEKLDVNVIVGGGTSAEVLRQAGVAEAELFIACTGLDEVNIVACGMANQIGSPQTLCFVSREDVLKVSEKREGLELFGINRVVWPEAQLAEDIERVVAIPGAIDAEEFAGGAVRLLEYRLDPGSPLIGPPLATLKLPHGSLIVAVRRADTFFIPRGDTVLITGDKIVVMGTPDEMEEVQRQIVPGHTHGHQTVTIIGGGDVGLRLAERLDRLRSLHVRVIERDASRGEMLAARLRRALVLQGDGTDLALLEAEDIGKSDVMVSVIDNDEKNLLASLLGRQLGVRRIITRVSKPDNRRLFERVGVDVALSARGAAIASVLHQIEGGQASLLAVLEEGEGRILEFQVPTALQGKALRDLTAPRESIVGAILRGAGAIVPRGTDRLQSGDRLLVFSTRRAAEDVRAFFSKAAS